MNAKTVNDTIPFCEGAELTSIKRTLELFGVLCFGFELLWVLGAHMKVQRLLLEEALFTNLTLVGQLFLVLFHMIVHRGLIALLVITMRTGE